MTELFPVHYHRLANGLRIAVAPDTGTAMVAVNVLYDTGARDEKRELTGMAHLFEHLMFGASANIPSYEDELEHAGGRCNAWTSSDFTNFYDCLPAQNIETAFHLESDRMSFLDVSDKALAVQKGVVIEEFKQQCLDKPYGDLYHHLRRLCYAPEHPYSWPVIGLTPEHIQKATQADVEQWYKKHYSPSQAILAVSGRVRPDDVFALAEKWFGDLSATTQIPRQMPSPQFPTDDIYDEKRGDVPATLITIAIPMDIYGTQRYHAADAITDLLAAGRSARFHSHIVHGSGRGRVTAADASILGCEHEGLLLLTARLTDDSDENIKTVRQLLIDEARKLSLNGEISPREWQRSVNNFEATFRFSNNNYTSRASNLAQAVYHNSDIDEVVIKRRELTIKDIQNESDRLFNSKGMVTFVYRPNTR